MTASPDVEAQIEAVALAPCPFCGGEAKFCDDDSYGNCSVGCGCEVEPFVNRRKAQKAECIAAWNRRAAMPDAGRLRAEVLEGVWQHIASAPRDGTPVLIYCPRARRAVCEAWWAHAYEGGPGYWSTPVGPAGRGYMIMPTAATHWQPLPAPPALAHAPEGPLTLAES